MIRIAVYSTLAIASVSIASLISNQSNNTAQPAMIREVPRGQPQDLLPIKAEAVELSHSQPVKTREIQPENAAVETAPIQQAGKQQLISVESPVLMVWQNNKTGKWESRNVHIPESPAK